MTDSNQHKELLADLLREYPSWGHAAIAEREKADILVAALTAIQQAAGVEHRAEDFESFAYATATAALNGVRRG